MKATPDLLCVAHRTRSSRSKAEKQWMFIEEGHYVPPRRFKIKAEKQLQSGNSPVDVMLHSARPSRRRRSPTAKNTSKTKKEKQTKSLAMNLPTELILQSASAVSSPLISTPAPLQFSDYPSQPPSESSIFSDWLLNYPPLGRSNMDHLNRDMIRKLDYKQR